MKVNKLILFLFILCISIFIFSNSSYAAQEMTEAQNLALQTALESDLAEYDEVKYVLTTDSNDRFILYTLCVNDNTFNSHYDRDIVGVDDIKRVVFKTLDFRYYLRVRTMKFNASSFTISSTNVMEPSTDNTGTKAFMVVDFISSDFNIYHIETGELFFQGAPLVTKTLAEEILAVTQAEMPILEEKTSRQMMTIVLCGVGCLALLVALPILLKVFWKFL